MEMLRAGTSSGGALGGAFDSPKAGQSSSGATSAGGGASPAEGGRPNEGGTAGYAGEAGATGEAGAGSGVGGTGAEPPSIEPLLGDYDVYVPLPPVINGCSPTWLEPRMNLALFLASSGEFYAQLFADFYWQATLAQEPRLGVHTIEVPALSDGAHTPLAPALTLDWDANGLRGTGFVAIPYTCQNGTSTTRRVPVTVKADHTPPKLRVDSVGFTILGFTRFVATFSEPITLPSGDYNTVFSEPSDGEQALEFYDSDTSATLPTAWKWAIGGPVAQAHFVDPGSVEGRIISARLIASLSDRAGNPMDTLGQGFYIQRSAILDTELDFDHPPATGMFDGASYHAAAEAGAECEQGGCLVLDGPVVACSGAPQSMFAVRLSSAWNTDVQVRYRVWASTNSVAPLTIGYASGCSGTFYTDLSPLTQPDGTLTHASEWQTVALRPCGDPEYEVGFTLSVACAESAPAPAIRVVLERMTRAK